MNIPGPPSYKVIIPSKSSKTWSLQSSPNTPTNTPDSCRHIVFFLNRLPPLQSNHQDWSMMSAQVNGNYLSMSSVLGMISQAFWILKGCSDVQLLNVINLVVLNCILAGFFFPKSSTKEPQFRPIFGHPSYFHSWPFLKEPDPRSRMLSGPQNAESGNLCQRPPHVNSTKLKGQRYYISKGFWEGLSRFKVLPSKSWLTVYIYIYIYNVLWNHIHLSQNKSKGNGDSDTCDVIIQVVTLTAGNQPNLQHKVTKPNEVNSICPET